MKKTLIKLLGVIACTSVLLFCDLAFSEHVTINVASDYPYRNLINRTDDVKVLYIENNDKFSCRVEVLLDNRKERAGIMFADSELLGIPHRFVISDTHADSGNIEYKSRNEVDKIEIEFKAAIDFILAKLA